MERVDIVERQGLLFPKKRPLPPQNILRDKGLAC
jgi:hypothetical protein